MPLSQYDHSHRRSSWPALALVPAAVAGGFQPVHAQGVDAPAADWHLDSAASDAIAPAIRRVVEPMNFVVRMVARRRLTALNPAFPAVRLTVGNADTVGITWGAGREARAVPNAGRAPLTDHTGEHMTVRLTSGGAADSWALQEVYVTDDGTRSNTWALRPDGLLHGRVSVTGPRLPQALTYRLVYRRRETSR